MTGDFKELKIWQKSMDLCQKIYLLIKSLPQDERYALSDQIRRSCISIPSNIAEGHGRNTEKEFIQFLHIARGSLYELETQTILCNRLYGLYTVDVLDSIREISKMIRSFISFLNKKSPIQIDD